MVTSMKGIHSVRSLVFRVKLVSYFVQLSLKRAFKVVGFTTCSVFGQSIFDMRSMQLNVTASLYLQSGISCIRIVSKQIDCFEATTFLDFFRMMML